MTTLTGSVSVAGIQAELAEEIAGGVSGNAKPVAMQEGDKVLADLSNNDELRALFSLKTKYMRLAVKNAQAFQTFGALPFGTTDEQAVEIGFKRVVYEELFWNLARKLAGQYGPYVGIREGFILVEPQVERPSGKAGVVNLAAELSKAIN